jgi:hypothetical protein
MSRSFNGSSQFLQATYPVLAKLPALPEIFGYEGKPNAQQLALRDQLPRVVTGPPFTLACWFNPNALVGQIMVHLGQIGISPDGYWISVGADGQVEALAASGGLGLTGMAESTASHTVGNWHHACGVFGATTSRWAYLDGGHEGTNNAYIVPGVPITGVSVAVVGSSSTFGYFSGRLAEIAIWDIDLMPSEVAQLGRAVSPLLIRPARLVAYWPLIGPVTTKCLDVVGGLGLSILGGAATAPHCRVYYPSTGFGYSFPPAPVTAIEITPPFVSNPFQVFAPTVIKAGSIAPPFVSNPFQVFPPLLTLLPFDQAVGTSSFAAGYIDEPSNLLIAANNARATLGAPLTATAVPPFTLTLSGDVSKFADSGAITIDIREDATASSSEILYFEGKTGQTLTITARAQDETTAKAFSTGALVQMRNVARHHNLLAETIIDVEAAIFTQKTAIDMKAPVQHGHAIADVDGLQAELDSMLDQSAVDTRVARTGDVMTGALTLSGAPTADLHAATRRYVDEVGLGWYNAKLRGLAGNGTTDDTAALQSLMNTLGAVGGGRIYFPPGVYLIGGPLQDPSGINAQITFPSITVTQPPAVIEFHGPIAPPTQFYIGSPVGLPGCATIKSTLTGASGTAACIAGREVGGYPTNLWDNVQFLARNMVFQAPPNASFTMINCFNIQGPHFYHCLFHAGALDMNTIIEPTHSNSFAIKLAPSNHSGNQTLDVVNIYGFYNGVLDGELVTMNHANCVGVKRAFVIPFNNHLSNHGTLGIWNCQNGICAAGVGYTGQNNDNGTKYIQIQALAIEQNWSAGGYGPAWADSVYDVDDPLNLLIGEARWLVVKAGTGNSHNFIKNGGANLRTKEVGAA